MVTVPSIPIGEFGRVTKLGLIKGLITTGYQEMQCIYVDPDNKGK
jgi:hypothetical protein